MARSCRTAVDVEKTTAPDGRPGGTPGFEGLVFTLGRLLGTWRQL